MAPICIDYRIEDLNQIDTSAASCREDKEASSKKIELAHQRVIQRAEIQVNASKMEAPRLPMRTPTPPSAPTATRTTSKLSPASRGHQLMLAVISTLISSLVILAHQAPGSAEAANSTQSLQQQQSSPEPATLPLRQLPLIEPFAFGPNVRENQRATVVCRVTNGDLPLQIGWLKDGQLLTPQLGQTKRISIRTGEDSSTLRLMPAKLEQAGNYTCVATNRAGSQSHSSQLVIHGPNGDPLSSPTSSSRTKRHDVEMLLDNSYDDDQSVRPHHEPLLLDASLEQLEPEAEARHQQQQQQQQQRGKRTLYACEEKQLQIECQLGESIQLIRANYGRFSIQICNEHGQLDWKVNCMSPASFHIITNSCQAKQSCQLLASNSIFGDSCPGTQKYLEVHYQCVPSGQLQTNRTAPEQANSNRGNQATAAAPVQRPNRPIVIQPQESSFAGSAMAPATTAAYGAQPQGPANTNSESRPARPTLPTWMGDLPLTLSSVSPAIGPGPSVQIPADRNASAAAAAAACPEMVRRQVRWPATEPGLVVQMPCPAHALPSNPLVPYAASLACLAGGQWASRVQSARCQSIWLQNLTRSLDEGDSPLSILTELAQRTRPATGFPGASGWPQQPATPSGSPLFGDDLVQIGRIVRRLVDGLGEFLTNGIHDDKQRSSFAREILQSLVELINNLAQELQLDAWLDLAPAQGERQRVAGQLLQALEGAGALLAYHQQPSADGHQEFLKVTDNVYVAIRTLAPNQETETEQQQQQQQAANNRTLEVSFPSESSLLGTRWMSREQRFTLHLQTSGGAGDQSQVDVKYSGAGATEEQQQQLSSPLPGGQSLRIVFVMLQGLGAQMEPLASASELAANRMIVNSNLVSLAIVPDSRYKFAPIKVHLSAPIELIFRHLVQEPAKRTPSGFNNGPRCAYWDTAVSDWHSDGCKLIATNRTHSTCACDHLTSFALLTEWDEQTAHGQLPMGFAADGVGGQNRHHHHQQQQPKVQLDSVENELILANKMLHLAKLLDGQLFGLGSGDHYQQQQSPPPPTTNGRLLIYVSCLFSAALLALHLAAAAYNRAHARRLLAALPAHQPPPTLLVSSGRPSHLAAALSQSAGTTDSSPTYGSDYSAALAATKTKLEAEAAYEPAGSTAKVVGSHTVASSGGCGSLQLRVPIHLLVKLLALQLLLVLLVESQGYLWAQRRALRHFQQVASFALPTPAQDPLEPLDPIGPVTWLLVGALYYLVAATTCWLGAQLVQLNFELCPRWAGATGLLAGSDGLASSLTTSSSGGSDKSANAVVGHSTAGAAHHYGAVSNATNSSQLSGSSLQQQQQQHPGSIMFGRSQLVNGANSNLYGAPGACFATGHQQSAAVGALHSANSPTSSFSSSADQHTSTALSRLEDSARLYGTGAGINQQQQLQRHGAHLGLLGACGQHKLLAFVEHALAPLLVALVCWLSANSSRTLNSVAFATSFWAQVAHWPLLVEASLSAFDRLLYYGPSLCLLLAAIALLRAAGVLGGRRARRPFKAADNPAVTSAAHSYPNHTGNLLNPYGSSHLGATNALTASNHFLSGPGEQQLGAALNKQSEAAKPTAGADLHCGWQRPADMKRTKLLCGLLLGLLALHSISWISFFGHIQQALNSHPAHHHLIYAFALANLSLALLLSWSQRRSLRRAAQLIGLTRLLSRCLWCSAGAQARQHAHFYQQAGGKSHSLSSSSAPLKVSPSGQSLFIISQAAAQQQQQHQQRQQQYGTTSYHYGPTYTSGSNQIYQQHIYESTGTLNEQQHRLNMMQLMQQQQQQLGQLQHLDSQQQQPLNRSLSSLQQHLTTGRLYNAGLDNQQQQQQLRQHMTLKPQGPTSLMHQHQQPSMIDLEPTGQLKQQQQFAGFNQQQVNPRQAPGEADGPLVAFSSSQPPTTFGPISTSLAAAPSQQAAAQSLFGGASLQQQQQRERQQQRRLPTEHQLFSQQQKDQQQSSSSQSSTTSPINCISDQFQQQQHSERYPTSVADANQHQYYSINNNNNGHQHHKPAPQQPANYADALKLAMIQQQQNESSSLVSHHFRRASSRAGQQQPLEQRHQLAMIDRNNCATLTNGNNIYDVANFALNGQQ